MTYINVNSATTFNISVILPLKTLSNEIINSIECRKTLLWKENRISKVEVWLMSIAKLIGCNGTSEHILNKIFIGPEIPSFP